MIALVSLFLAAIVVVGIGAFLLGTQRTTEMVGGSAGIAGDAPEPVDPPASVEVSTTTAAAPVPTTAATTSVPETTASETTAATTAAPTSAPPALAIEPADSTALPEVLDDADAARADLQRHFDNHDRLDLDAAYTGLSSSFAPPFDDFVRFWEVDVELVNSPIDECNVTGDRGTCSVRFFITYSDAADEGVRGKCVGQAVELTMQRTDGRFLIDDQRNLGPLDCPTQ